MRKWNSSEISWALYSQAFRGKHIVVAQNTYWPGSECDILVVRNDLRLMEVEIKISRQDLKIDKHKDKWKKWQASWPIWQNTRPEPEQRTHPLRIWKHYYALPTEIWKPELVEEINPCSGIILIDFHKAYEGSIAFFRANIRRQAKPNKEAKPITPEDAVDIARIQNMKYWELIEQGRLDRATRDSASSVSETDHQLSTPEGSLTSNQLDSGA